MKAVRRGGDHGSVSTELALITPVLVTLLLIVVSLGRVASARGDVDAAARDAARAAANARSAPQAIAVGDAAARVALIEGGVTCRALLVDIDISAFRAGGVVRATVSCNVELESLTGVALPGSRTVTASFLAPIDVYRGVS